ncbi:MAG: hypothetical protein GY756_25270 [bacterium]|nr:hypothetical protein [bacterium]
MKIKSILIICIFLTLSIHVPAQDSTFNDKIHERLEQDNTETYPRIDPEQYNKYLLKQKEFFTETNQIVEKHKLNPWGKKNTKIYNSTKNTENMSKRVRYNYENVYGKPVLNTNINNYNKMLNEQKAYWNKLDSMTNNDERVPSIHGLKKPIVDQEHEEFQKKLDESKKLGI